MSKLMENFNFLFHFREKLFTFDPFVSLGLVTSQAGSNFESFTFGLYHCISDVKISENAKFQLFIPFLYLNSVRGSCIAVEKRKNLSLIPGKVVLFN